MVVTGAALPPRRLLVLAAIVVATLLAGGVVAVDHALAGSGRAVVRTAGAPSPLPTVPPSTTTTTAPPAVPVSTQLATPHGNVPTYAYPGGPGNGTVGVWYGYALVLPVVDTRPGWLEVRLPQRPNQSVAWIQTDEATLSSTPYRIVVKLATERLTVYKDGYPAMDFPVGIGTPATPTVTGSYFVTVHAPAPSPGYGPFVLSTSAHSDAIQSWEGAGDALIAIHGPITESADARIGQPGAQISNGCIRMHDADLAQLAVIPIGTPVDIEA